MADDTTAVLRQALDQAAQLRRERDEARSQFRQEVAGRIGAQEMAVDSSISAAEQERQALQAQWAALQQEGKFEEAGQALTKLTDASARIAQLRTQKDWLSRERETARAEPADPLAAYTPAERDWINRNPRYLSDPAFKAKVDGAYGYVTGVKGLSRDSAEAFAEVEKMINPPAEPAAAGAGNGTDGAAAKPAANGTAAADPGNGAAEPAGEFRQEHHNVDAPIRTPTREAAMRIDTGNDPAVLAEVDQTFPQRRAIGKGGDGIQGVAAPPSRRVRELSNRAAAGGVIEPTMEELDTARTLYRQINGDAAGSDEDAVRWYHAMYHTPSATRKRQRWYGEAR